MKIRSFILSIWKDLLRATGLDIAIELFLQLYREAKTLEACK